VSPFRDLPLRSEALDSGTYHSHESSVVVQPLQGYLTHKKQPPPTRIRVQDVGFRVQGSGFRVPGSRCKFQGSGFRIQVTPPPASWCETSRCRVKKNERVLCLGSAPCWRERLREYLAHKNLHPPKTTAGPRHMRTGVPQENAHPPGTTIGP